MLNTVKYCSVVCWEIIQALNFFNRNSKFMRLICYCVILHGLYACYVVYSIIKIKYIIKIKSIWYIVTTVGYIT